MIYLILFFIAVIICLLCSIVISKNGKSLLQYFVEANNLVVIQYLLFSCFFIFFESFEVYKPLICVIGLDILVLLIAFLRGDFIVSKKISGIAGRIEITLVVFACISLPLVWETSEDIGTVSDQGTYFYHTMTLMEGKEKQTHTLNEMGLISETVDTGLRELQDDLTIFYHYDGEDYYYIHSLRTWCSLPALFGKFIDRWQSLLSINYLLLLACFNLFYICEKIAVNKWGKYLSLTLFGMSPLILYIGKAGLTEVVSLYLFLGALYYLFAGEKRLNAILAGVFLGLSGFIHISIYVYLPIITVILFLKSLKEKRFAYANLVQLFLYICSLWYAWKISPIYTEIQYSRFTVNDKIDTQNLFFIITILVCIILIVQLSIFRYKYNILNKPIKFLQKHFRTIVIIVLSIIAIRTIFYAYNLAFTDLYLIPDGIDAGTWNMRNRYVNTGIEAFSYLNVVNIARATGFIGLIVFIILPFLKRKSFSKKGQVFYGCGLYGLMIFAVFQMDTPYNYYSSRYFIPFLIPVITLTLACCIKNTKSIIAIIVIALLYYSQYWGTFIDGGPQIGQYRILQDTMATIPENSIVLCNPQSTFVNTRLTSNLRMINENMVYNLNNFDEVYDYYEGENIYVISSSEIKRDNLQLILYNIYPSQYSFGNGENGTYAKSNPTYDNPLYIYQVCG